MLEYRGKEQSSNLIQIQAGTSGPPFFFMHGDFHGGGYYCYQMARNMGLDQPFYALQPHGLPGRPLPSTIENMAAEYLALIRASFPQGPYLLGGHCNGGLIAFEIAQRLMDEGCKVDLLVMMDPPVAPGPDDARARAARLQPLGRANMVMMEMDIDHLPPELRHNTLMQLYRDVCKNYVPKFYAGKLTLFLAQENLDARELARGWRQFANSVEAVLVPGNHVSMITNHIDTLAQKLIECRDKSKWD